MRNRIFTALVTVLLLLPGVAMAQSGSNGNYYQYTQRSDGQIGTPPSGKVRFFWNGTNFRYKDSAAAFFDVGGAGISGLTTNYLPVATSATAIGNSFFIQGGDATNPRFNFGGTTSSFPMLRRNGTTIEAKLADNSAFAPMQITTLAATGMTIANATGNSFFTVDTDDSAGFAYFLLNAGTSSYQIAVGGDGAPAGYGGTFYFYDASVPTSKFAVTGGVSGNAQIASGGQFTFTSTAGAVGTPDTGVARASAAVVKVTNGSSGYGDAKLANLQAASDLSGTLGTSGLRFTTVYANSLNAGAGQVLGLTTGDQYISLGNIATGPLWVLDGGGAGGTLGEFRPNGDNAYDIGDSTHQVRSTYSNNFLHRLLATAGAGNPTVDLATGDIQELTLSNAGGAHTITWSNIKAGAYYTITIIQDATNGGETVTWPAATKWVGGSAPTLTATTSARDIFTFYSDGTNLYETGRNLDVR